MTVSLITTTATTYQANREQSLDATGKRVIHVLSRMVQDGARWEHDFLHPEI
jgi:hypothetical protein